MTELSREYEGIESGLIAFDGHQVEDVKNDMILNVEGTVTVDFFIVGKG